MLSSASIPEASRLPCGTQVAGKETLYSKGKILVLVSLLNLIKTKFIGFDIQFWVASFLSFPIDLGDMTFP